MVKIRLFQTGSKHQRSYRLVVIDSRKKRNGQTLEVLGFFDPKTKPPTLKYKRDRFDYWLKKGAQPTATVKKITEK